MTTLMRELYDNNILVLERIMICKTVELIFTYGSSSPMKQKHEDRMTTPSSCPSFFPPEEFQYH